MKRAMKIRFPGYLAFVLTLSAVLPAMSFAGDGAAKLKSMTGFYDAIDRSGNTIQVVFIKDYEVNGLLAQLFDSQITYRFSITKFNKADWIGESVGTMEIGGVTREFRIPNEPTSVEVHKGCDLDSSLLQYVEDKPGMKKVAGLRCDHGNSAFVVSQKRDSSEISLIQVYVNGSRVIGGRTLPLVQTEDCFYGRGRCLPGGPDLINDVDWRSRVSQDAAVSERMVKPESGNEAGAAEPDPSGPVEGAAAR